MRSSFEPAYQEIFQCINHFFMYTLCYLGAVSGAGALVCLLCATLINHASVVLSWALRGVGL